MAGAFHGVGEPDCVIHVGVSGPGVVQAAIKKCPDGDLGEIAEVIKRTAFKITRMGQLVGTEASRRLGVPIYPVGEDGFELCDAFTGILPEVKLPKRNEEETEYYRYNQN